MPGEGAIYGTPHEHLPTPEPGRRRRGGRWASPVARPAQNIRICVASSTVREADGADQNGGSARVLSESICHSARCHAAGETCYQNVEPVLGDQHGGSKLDLVLLVVGSQVGSHRRSTWGHIEPATPFDSGCSAGIQRRPATSADTRDLVRIEGSGVRIPSAPPSSSRSGGLFGFWFSVPRREPTGLDACAPACSRPASG